MSKINKTQNKREVLSVGCSNMNESDLIELNEKKKNQVQERERERKRPSSLGLSVTTNKSNQSPLNYALIQSLSIGHCVPCWAVLCSQPIFSIDTLFAFALQCNFHHTVVIHIIYTYHIISDINLSHMMRMPMLIVNSQWTYYLNPFRWWNFEIENVWRGEWSGPSEKKKIDEIVKWVREEVDQMCAIAVIVNLMRSILIQYSKLMGILFERLCVCIYKHTAQLTEWMAILSSLV